MVGGCFNNFVIFLLLGLAESETLLTFALPKRQAAAGIGPRAAQSGMWLGVSGVFLLGFMPLFPAGGAP